MEQLKTAVAMVFKNHGKREMKRKEFVLAVSMDLRWFPPAEAEEMLAQAERAGLVRSDGDAVVLNFSLEDVRIPLNFRPTRDVLKVDVVRSLVEEAASQAGVEREKVFSRINQLKEDRNLDTGVAALIVAKEYGVDISRYITPVEERLLGDADEEHNTV